MLNSRNGAVVSMLISNRPTTPASRPLPPPKNLISLVKEPAQYIDVNPALKTLPLGDPALQQPRKQTK
jgi:hypothetical protein